MDTIETQAPHEGGSAGGPVFDAFISYSHSADDLLAPRLQSGLQRFAKPWWKRRSVRVFRDETSLSASPHLWTSITDALDASEWFVLLMSPTAALSDWVNKEVEYWLEHKEANRILPGLTDGSFKWRDHDFVSEAAPPALHGAFSEDPRWVDRRFARTDEQLDLQNPRFSAAVADIASAIRGVPGRAGVRGGPPAPPHHPHCVGGGIHAPDPRCCGAGRRIDSGQSLHRGRSSTR